jgi:hypothetical protein
VNDVVVSVDEKSTAGYQVSDKEGIARWKVKLAAGEKKKIDFQYRVEVPSSYDSGGM